MNLSPYASRFINLALEKGVLQFGDFTLKSGRKSPYFFNAGLFNDGKSLVTLGECYAAAINEKGFDYDVLFAPAYKGIPLVCTTVSALALHYNINKPYTFNRKEAKNHGEGGMIVGAPLHGRVLILDDVITAGTALREILPLLKQHNVTIAGLLIGLDRQEKGTGSLSSVQEIAQEIQAPVASIICLDELITFSKHNPTFSSYSASLQDYRDKFGVVS